MTSTTKAQGGAKEERRPATNGGTGARPSKPGAAPWRAVFNTAESAVAAQLEPLVHRRLFGIGIGLAKSADAAARRQFERRTRRALHFLNLPTATDIRLLHQHLAAVEDRMSDVLAERDAARRGEEG